jgi:glucose-6-phosphate 1-dehydrogenase
MMPWTLVILGMSGDLAKRQILPALYSLYVYYKSRNEQHPFIIIGAGYQNVTVDQIFLEAATYIHKPQQELLEELSALTIYCGLDFADDSSFITLAHEIFKQEKAYQYPGNRIFYCATYSQFFCNITKQLAAHGLIEKGDKNHRVVYEKPFGSDVTSAHHINQCIRNYLNDDQIYRIDHYLTKEIVNNIVLLRFANILFEPLWNNRFINHVHVLIGESIGIEGRGAFYDAHGALKDVFQSHLLQLVALVAMDCPASLSDDDSIRDSKAAILQRIRVVKGILGQYEGYRHEPGVATNSMTETFAAVELAIDNPRWQGVPFYVVTGKHLDHKATEIHLVFKSERTCLFGKTQEADPNILIIRVTHEEGFSLRLNAKKPYTRGTQGQTIPVLMDFCYRCLFGPETPKAYEILFREIIAGEQSIAVRWDEIEYQWSVVDEAKKMNFPLYSYKKGTRGPEQAECFMPSFVPTSFTST